MVLWILISIGANDSNAHTSQIIVNYIKWFLLYRLVALTISTPNGLPSAIGRLVFFGYIIVVEAIYHKYFSETGLGWAGQPLGWVDQSVIEAGGTGRTKWINIFDGPGVFCVLFTLILPFFFVNLNLKSSKFKKLLALMFLVPLLLAIWTTGSRGGFLATLAIFGAYFLYLSNISFSTIIKVSILGTVIFMMAPSHLTQMKDDNRSAQHRVDMWMRGLDMIETNPLFGVGKGNYINYTGRLIAHNSFIEIMSETGSPGILLWVALLYFSFKTIRAYVKIENDPKKINISIALAISLIGYLASSFFVTLEYETLYFMLGLTRSLSEKKSLDVNFTSRDALFILGIYIGMYLLLKVFVNIYYL